jgi:Tol biopolymer transport system component
MLERTPFRVDSETYGTIFCGINRTNRRDDVSRIWWYFCAMQNEWTVGAALHLTDSKELLRRPSWNVDGRSIVIERADGVCSSLHVFRRNAVGTWSRDRLDLCNDSGCHVQGRAAFFGLDDFAFVSDRGGRPTIWRADLKSARLTQLTEPADGSSDYGPATRPGSTDEFFFFRVTDATGKPYLYHRALGNPEQQLTAGRDDANQPWPIKGSNNVVFHSKRDGTHAAYHQCFFPMKTAFRLSDLDEATEFVTPFPSPDGRHIVFSSSINGTAQICVMRIDGTWRQQLTFGSAPAYFPTWSPVDNRIAYIEAQSTSGVPAGRLCLFELLITPANA